MAARRILLEIEGVVAAADLLDDLSPVATEALWKSLPIETTLIQTKWSGAACYFRLPSGALADVREIENPVCSIYPGTLVLSPEGGEMLIAHGASEYRRQVGTDYVTRVAWITTNRPAFLEVLRRMRDDGVKQLTIRRAE